MRILLDECVDQRLRLLFARHECHTAAYAKLAGLKNGVLLDAAEAAGFEVLITTDQEILRPLMPATTGALCSITEGAVIRIR